MAVAVVEGALPQQHHPASPGGVMTWAGVGRDMGGTQVGRGVGRGPV